MEMSVHDMLKKMIQAKFYFTRIAVLLGILCFGVDRLPAQEILIQPYLQPGNGTTLEGHDVKVVAWMTDSRQGEFCVEYGLKGSPFKMVQPMPVLLRIGDSKRYLLYRATLEPLPFDSVVEYRVTQSGQTMRESSFRTRASRNEPIKFVMLGDGGEETPEPRKIVYQMSRLNPDFGITLGDVVYTDGRLGQYLHHYVNYYINTAKASPDDGAPIMASVPFYQVIGNHDVKGMNLGEYDDGMAFFYLWHPPLNGPKNVSVMPGVAGSPAAVEAFKMAAGANDPLARNYSFDNGPAHFLMLDANAYVNVADPTWRSWIEKDLMATKAKWKFVCFHQPGIHSSIYHYEEQRMRAFAPLFEKCGVDMVFSGHVHNYERTKPLRFVPSENLEKMAISLMTGRKSTVPGTFTLDELFDGERHTVPKGVIYIVSGAGGRKLADPELTDHPELWKRDPATWAPYTVKFVADRHSFTEVVANSQEVVLRQIDLDGNEVDKIRITKP